ncbi:unnamed protein product, partial [Nesidiocoris tenuis]
RHSIQNRKTRGGTRVTDDGQHVLTRFLCVTLCCTSTLSNLLEELENIRFFGSNRYSEKW